MANSFLLVIFSSARWQAWARPVSRSFWRAKRRGWERRFSRLKLSI